MSRTPLTLLTTALLATIALAGCKRDEAPAADTTPAATEPAPMATTPPADTMPPAPMPGATGTAPVNVTMVDLGSAIGGDNKVSTATTTFKPADTVYVAVATDGTASNVPLTAKWTYQDGQVVHTETKTLNTTGPTVTEFHVSKPDGWPAGNYKVEVSAGGTVLQTKDFTVQ